MADSFPVTARLTPLFRERQFWSAVVIGLPGIAYAYAQALQALAGDGAYDAVGASVALAANPVTIYLAARQYPRGKAADAVGMQVITQSSDVVAGNPPTGAEGSEGVVDPAMVDAGGAL